MRDSSRMQRKSSDARHAPRSLMRTPNTRALNRASSDPDVKQPCVIAPVLWWARGTPSFPCPLGHERERSAGRRVLVASRLAADLRSPPRRGVHASCDASASRRSTAALNRRVRSRGGPAVIPGPRFRARHWRRPVQRAPRRASVVTPGRGPGAARVRGERALARGMPHLAPPARRLMMTPSDERGGTDYRAVQTSGDKCVLLSKTLESPPRPALARSSPGRRAGV